jgi:hypothetical protein
MAPQQALGQGIDKGQTGRDREDGRRFGHRLYRWPEDSAR